MYRRLMAGVSLLPFLAPPDDDGGGAPAAAPPAPAPAAPAPEPAPAAAAAAPAGDPPAPAAPEPESQEPKPARVPWQVKRIDQLTATNKANEEARAAAEARASEAERRAAAYEALYGAQGAPPPTPAPPGAPAAPTAGARTYSETDMQAEARRIAGINRLNERLDSVFQAGNTKHGQVFAARVGQAGQAFGEDLKGRIDFWETLAALPNPEDVYFDLTGDLDHFADMIAMPPARLGLELAMMSQKAASKPKGPAVSSVPAPINPLTGSSTPEVALDKVPMEDYVKAREAQREARYNAGRR